MNQDNINVIIENILSRRQTQRLPEVVKRLDRLKEVRIKLNELQNLVERISRELNAEAGPYFTLLSKDPEVLAKFKAIAWNNDFKDVGEKVKATIDELERLKNRFERPALRIAFVGWERQGKSTFLKTIAGLNNKIIPAYSGNSCTGAVSVIHNDRQPKLSDGTPVEVLVRVVYYSEGEMLKVVNGKLKKFFPSGIYQIGRLDQIPSLNLPDSPENNWDPKLCDEYIKFKETVIDHYSEYSNLIGTGIHEYHDENVIVQHVAQYEEFDHEVPNAERKFRGNKVYWERPYYKYNAVKTVDIYTAFNIEATEKLELVDTIGIGSSSDSESIREEMFRVLREDCDAAIDLFRPEINGAVPSTQTDILKEIQDKLGDMNPSKWIGYVVNKVCSGEHTNFPGGASSAHNSLVKSHSINSNNSVAWVKLIDGDDFNDVKDNLVLPLLSLISENLDLLDQQLFEKADSLGKDANDKCVDIVKNSSSVISADLATNANSLALFVNHLYPDMLKEFGIAMNKLDVEGYAKHQDEPCGKLATEYEKVIGAIGSCIPKKKDLYEQFIAAMGLTEVVLFQETVEQLRNDIFTAYEDVNTTVLYPLQEQVKMDIIKVLYEEGLMKHLPVPIKGPSTQWLRSVIDNYVDEKTYPYFRRALEFILDYKINIEGMVEFNVAKSLNIIDPAHREFIPYRGEHGADFDTCAENVWQELRSRRKPVASRLSSWIESFSVIPSHSFYSRVHKFHLKVMSDKNGRKDFRNFYLENMSLFWTDVIVKSGITQKAFGEWNEKTKALQHSVSALTFYND